MGKKRVVKIVLSVSLGIVAVGLAVGGYSWYQLNKTMKAMYEPLPSTEWVQPRFEEEPPLQDEPPAKAEIGEEQGKIVSPAGKTKAENAAPEGAAAVQPAASKEPLSGGEDQAFVESLRHPDLGREDPFALLLLGVDERQGDRGRSDTMILLAIQPAKHSVKAISIPRDTRIVMPGKETYDKINHAYAFGGTPLAVTAVEGLFGIPIAFYMKTNMEGLVDIVDTVGGVDVDNERAFSYEGYTFPLGAQHLKGDEALAYVRMRKEDPNGDFGRTERQRELLSAAVDRISSFRSLGKFPKLLSQLSRQIRTNLKSGDMMRLALDYRPSIEKIDTLYLQGKGATIGGIYYYTVRPEDRREIRDDMMAHLKP